VESTSRRGLVYGAAAYGLWGLFPLYWPLLEPAGAVEILAHRVLWSAITISLVVTFLRRWPDVRAVWRDRRSRLLLVSAALVISVNWSIYIYGVNSGRVVETSLGYFINPLVTVLMGVVVLSERLRALQWAALTLAAGAVVVLALDYGRLPWIALVLAFSFGTYGLLKKQAGVDPLESLTLETVVLAPLAVAYLVWLGVRGDSGVLDHGAGHAALFLTTGVVTVVPLLFFGAAAIRLPLVTIGLLQYLAPVIQFLLGVLWYDESMPAARWIGFTLVWIALVVFTLEALQHRRRHLRLLGESALPV
jgi:chloramphenicol-sensitive protein RarD